VQARDPQAACAALTAGGYTPSMLPAGWVEDHAAVHPPAGLLTGWIELDDPRAISQPEQVTAYLAHAGLPPAQVILEEEDLEQYFLRLVETQP
jgi:ABC-2 type transport system ATP-binding protein